MNASRLLAALGYVLLALILMLVTFMMAVPQIMWNMSHRPEVAPPGFGWVFLAVLLIGFIVFRIGQRMVRVLRGSVPAWSWPTYVIYALVMFFLLQVYIAFPYFLKK